MLRHMHKLINQAAANSDGRITTYLVNFEQALAVSFYIGSFAFFELHSLKRGRGVMRDTTR